MWRPPGHHGVERGTKVPWLLLSLSPNPQPQALLPTPVVQEELIQGRRKAPSRTTSFTLLVLCQEGAAGQEQETEKEREVTSTSCLLEMLSLLPGSCRSLELWGAGEAVILCLFSPEHYLTHVTS